MREIKRENVKNGNDNGPVSPNKTRKSVDSVNSTPPGDDSWLTEYFHCLFCNQQTSETTRRAASTFRLDHNIKTCIQLSYNSSLLRKLSAASDIIALSLIYHMIAQLIQGVPKVCKQSGRRAHGFFL